jgi:DNA repair protein RecN (Recombination protein N)
MLQALEIRNMLLIDRLDLAFQSGLNVLTGETGAGKSILLDSLGFVLGWRGRADLVRTGADTGEVTAVFRLSADHPARIVLADSGFPVEDELILRRVNTADGRKTAWVNDRRTSGDVLRALSETLVELHGQQDDRGLLNTRGHRQLLDSFAGFAPLLAQVRLAWRRVQDARKAQSTAAAELAAVAAEEDFLRHAVAELDKLDPQSGEEATLDSRRRLMQAAERLQGDIVRALAAMSDSGAEGKLIDATRWLEGASDGVEGRLDLAISALGRVLNDLGEAQQGVEACLDALHVNPGELEMVEERLFALRGLARKHSVLPDNLGPFADDLRRRLAALDGGAKGIAALQKAQAEAQLAYTTLAEKLRAARQTAGAALDAAMSGELAPLKMERAVFATRFGPADAGPEGIDTVAFEVATNPGAPAGPLNKIASGGELSRFLLALKVCLTRGTTGVTMIFDEIDRGVGGATADAVGRRLRALADGAQVLVVTHSPQVAALGAHHWRVEKSVTDGMTTSTVTPLSADQRVQEIARMLSGDTISTAAKAAAAELLAG